MPPAPASIPPFPVSTPRAGNETAPRSGWSSKQALRDESNLAESVSTSVRTCAVCRESMSSTSARWLSSIPGATDRSVRGFVEKIAARCIAIQQAAEVLRPHFAPASRPTRKKSNCQRICCSTGAVA